MDKTKIAVDVFNKNAALYQQKYMDVTTYQEVLDLFCNSLPEGNAQVLELACGPGNITKYLLEKRPDLHLLATDLSSNMLDLARTNNPTAAFRLMDVRDLHTLNQQFDGIMCGFCLPYLSREEAEKLIADASLVLTPGGVLYISTMEDDYSKSGFITASTGDAVYMYYHTADYLTAAMEENGFHIISLQRKQYNAPDGTPTTDLLILAGK